MNPTTTAAVPSPHPGAWARTVSRTGRALASVFRSRHRAAPPSGYRFVADIPERDVPHAHLALLLTAPEEDILLVPEPSATDPQPDRHVALFVRRDHRVPDAFWSYFSLLKMRAGTRWPADSMPASA